MCNLKLSISNIAWEAKDDEEVFTLMKTKGFTGLEIAPTRVFPEAPYSDLERSTTWANNLKACYGFEVSSMQSIWYGRKEQLFGSNEERKILLEYTKEAIDFAESIGCKNLVFGCPKNRSLLENSNPKVAIDFFKELGDYAFSHNSILAMEANPVIYNTNYINDTPSAIALVKEVNSKGFKLNLDLGTMIYNGEEVALLDNNVNLINHVHISEPSLKPIVERDFHKGIIGLLKKENYEKYISIEVGKQESLGTLEKMMDYVVKLVNENDL